MAAITGAILGSLGAAYLSKRQGDKAVGASQQAGAQAVQGGRETLDYLKGREAMYDPYRMQGLEGLSEFTEATGTPMSHEELIAQAQNSPLYSAIMQGQPAAEESILRNAGATGKLRSGNVRTALARNAEDFSSQALLKSYEDVKSRDDYTRDLHLRGLGYLAGAPDMTATIGQQMGNLTQTQAQATLGAAQTRQNANQGFMNTLTGLGGLGIQAYNAGMFSDIRLKRNIRLVGEKNGHKLYTWYWNAAARVLGLYGKAVGCLAHEVFEKDFTAVGIRDGFLTINYEQIGVVPEGA